MDQQISDITFGTLAEGSRYTMLRLKRGKWQVEIEGKIVAGGSLDAVRSQLDLLNRAWTNDPALRRTVLSLARVA